MAEVYLARHVLIDRLSAIKLLRREMGGDRALRRTFLREAKAVNRINHPNIVEISDYGETEETAYLVMEYVPGESLARHLSRAPLGWERAAKVALQVAQALSRAHEMGVVHRDIQPRNVLLVPGHGGEDVVKLTDFGVAKLLDPSGDARPMTGGIVIQQLTPAYMAPEMMRLGAVDARGDLYSLGILAYEATCGVLPFADGQLREAPPTSLRDRSANVPEEFDVFVQRLLSFDADARPRDAFEVVATLRAMIGRTSLPAVEADPPTERVPERRSRFDFAKLQSLPFDRIGPLSTTFHEQVCAADADAHALSSRDVENLAEMRGMIDRLHALVLSDAERLATLEERARTLRNDVGARLDAIALERSRVLGWASSAAERSESARSRRLSGVLSVGTMDALLWEEATLDHQEDTSISRAMELGAEFDGLSKQHEAENDLIEREKSSMEAQLEGHVAALRALAGEAWMALFAAADKLRIDLAIPEV